MPDYLYQAAAVWDRLCRTQYHIIYGKKATLHQIYLNFYAEEFYHLAGFQYLKDIKLPKYSSKNMFAAVIENKIKQQEIEQSHMYKTMVEPRLLALISLETSLDSDFSLYTYMRKFYPFRTNIEADYLITAMDPMMQPMFVFIIKNGGKMVFDFRCCSTFTMGDRDYRTNQRLCTQLLKEKMDLTTNKSIVFFDRIHQNTKAAEKEVCDEDT